MVTGPPRRPHGRAPEGTPSARSGAQRLDVSSTTGRLATAASVFWLYVSTGDQAGVAHANSLCQSPQLAGGLQLNTRQHHTRDPRKRPYPVPRSPSATRSRGCLFGFLRVPSVDPGPPGQCTLARTRPRRLAAGWRMPRGRTATRVWGTKGIADGPPGIILGPHIAPKKPSVCVRPAARSTPGRHPRAPAAREGSTALRDCSPGLAAPCLGRRFLPEISNSNP